MVVLQRLEAGGVLEQRLKGGVGVRWGMQHHLQLVLSPQESFLQFDVGQVHRLALEQQCLDIWPHRPLTLH